MGQQKWQQMTQRWVKTMTVTEKSANTIVKYRQLHVFLLNMQDDSSNTSKRASLIMQTPFTSGQFFWHQGHLLAGSSVNCTSNSPKWRIIMISSVWLNSGVHSILILGSGSVRMMMSWMEYSCRSGIMASM